MPTCRFCNESVSPSDAYCPYCGADLDTDAEAEELSDDPISKLVRAGRKTEAIKVYRERFGVSLKDAKEAVEVITRQETPIDESDRPVQEVLALLRDGQKIPAVKLFRERSGMSLSQAKEAVDGIAREHGLISPLRGCFKFLLYLLIIGAAVAYFFW